MKQENIWKPDRNYYFGNKSQYYGQSIAVLMFNDHRYLRILFETIVSKALRLSFRESFKKDLSEFFKLSKKIENKSELHQNLEFYLYQGEKIHEKKSKIICPHCNEREAKYFPLVNYLSHGFSLNPEFVFCDNKECRKRARFCARENIAERCFKFSIFEITSKYLDADYYNKHRKDVIDLFKKVFSIPVINDQFAFDFFSK
ncbi:MAG: hypothetical protein ABIG10_00475 [bacterium]